MKAKDTTTWFQQPHVRRRAPRANTTTSARCWLKPQIDFHAAGNDNHGTEAMQYAFRTCLYYPRYKRWLQYHLTRGNGWIF
jgi:hypothetical protein